MNIDTIELFKEIKGLVQNKVAGEFVQTKKMVLLKQYSHPPRTWEGDNGIIDNTIKQQNLNNH